MVILFGIQAGDHAEYTVDSEDADLNEIHRFELLRKELIELEKRVQRSTDGSQDGKVGVR